MYASQDQINNINQRLLTSNVIYGISFIRFTHTHWIAWREKQKKSLSCQIAFPIVCLYTFRGKLIFASCFFLFQYSQICWISHSVCSLDVCLFVFYGIKPNNVSIKKCHTNLAKYIEKKSIENVLSRICIHVCVCVPLKPEYFNFSWNHKFQICARQIRNHINWKYDQTQFQAK